MQVEHKTEKGTITFKLSPEDTFDIKIRFKRFLTYRTSVSSHIELFDEGIFPIGLTSEVTEDQARDMFGGLSTGQLDGVWYSIDNGKNYSYETALSALKHIMQHLQVYEVNPNVCKSPNEFHHKQVNQDHYNLWKEAESRTGKWVVLFNQNEK